MEEKIIKWYDFEGNPIWGTIEDLQKYNENVHKIWECCKPKLNTNLGKVIIIGTKLNINEN